jgi:hypothetical protein
MLPTKKLRLAGSHAMLSGRRSRSARTKARGLGADEGAGADWEHAIATAAVAAAATGRSIGLGIRSLRVDGAPGFNVGRGEKDVSAESTT